jgi:hypothetical protein
MIGNAARNRKEDDVNTSTERNLDRKELRKRLEARREQLSAKIHEAEADAARAAKSHIQVWKQWLDEIDDAMSKGLETLEDDVVERLNRMLERSPDDDR